MKHLRKFQTKFVIAIVLVWAVACNETPNAETATADASEPAVEAAADVAAVADADAFYALGFAVSRNLREFHLTAEELEHVERGLEDGIMDREPKVDLETNGQRVQELARERSQQAAKTERAEGETFLAEAAAAPGAEKTESGLVVQTLEEGTGRKPGPSDTVIVHYQGSLRSGKVFDSSYGGEPVRLSLAQVIPCWSEGVQMIKVGGKAKITCPPELAYGDRPNGPIPPGSTLQFELELVDIAQ